MAVSPARASIAVPLFVTALLLARPALAQPTLSLSEAIARAKARNPDATVAAMARQIRDELAPGRTIYIEHSNEIWNNFPQGRDTEARGTALFGNVASAFERRLNAHGLRTAQICDIFRGEFAAQAARIVCTLGSQAANAFTADEAARCPLAQAAATDLIRAVAHKPVDDAVVEDTARRIASLRATPEAREGLTAFLEKRPAEWVPAGR